MQNDLIITLTIPCNGEPNKERILDWLEATLDDLLPECEETGEECRTLADELGFGGNTLMLSCGEDVREICL